MYSFVQGLSSGFSQWDTRISPNMVCDEVKRDGCFEFDVGQTFEVGCANSVAIEYLEGLSSLFFCEKIAQTSQG